MAVLPVVVLSMPSLTIALVASACPAYADTATNQYAQLKPRRPIANQFAAVHFNKELSLPELPSYPGKNAQFVHGISFPGALNGGSYILHYNALETPQAITQWYGTAFQMYKWKIDKVTNHSISAVSASGHYCLITVQGAYAGKGRCSFSIYYHVNDPSPAS